MSATRTTTAQPSSALARLDREEGEAKLARHAVDRVFPDAPEALRQGAAAALAPWVKKLVVALDDYGLDAIIGFVLPGTGDVLTGLGSISLLLVALQRGVPKVVLAKMLMNIGVDVIGGLVPILGDAFDLVWRSNRRNLALIEKYQDPGRTPTAGDYALVYGGIGLAVLSMILPFVVMFLVAGGMLGSLSR